MTLADYLKSEGRTGRWLAQRLGCSEQHISGIRKNNANPSRILAKAIERETGGAVPASQWTRYTKEPVCVGAHDRCDGGLCPYCERVPIKPKGD